MKLNIN
jgi:transposase InsO family protein